MVKGLWENEKEHDELESGLNEAKALMREQRNPLSTGDAIRLSIGRHQQALRDALEQVKRETGERRAGSFQDIPFTLGNSQEMQ